MNSSALSASIFAVVFASCGGSAHAAEAAIATKEIASYPFMATSARAAAILNGYKRIAVGMSPTDVKSILGEPDEIRPLYEPRTKNGKLIGYTHWYIIRRLVRDGSANDKQESLVRVSYGLDDHVSKIDSWGLSAS